MKKKNIVVIVAVAVGCVGVASLFAFQGPHPKAAVPTTSGTGVGGMHMPMPSTSGTIDQASGQVVHGDGFANVTAPNEKTMKKAYKEQLKDPSLSQKERREIKQKLRELKAPNTQKIKIQD